MLLRSRVAVEIFSPTQSQRLHPPRSRSRLRRSSRSCGRTLASFWRCQNFWKCSGWLSITPKNLFAFRISSPSQLELLLVRQALLRPGLLELREPALAALEETDGFGVGLLEAL